VTVSEKNTQQQPGLEASSTNKFTNVTLSVIKSEPEVLP
jgi:hypothetical protein